MKNVALKKTISASKAKKLAWAAFSRYIRFKYADFVGNCMCVTCGTVKNWKEMHAGHFIDGRNNTVLYDERLVFPQCFHCNSKLPGCLAGNKVTYTLFMVNQGFNLDQIREFESLKHKEKSMKAFEHLEIEAKYKKLFKDIGGK